MKKAGTEQYWTIWNENWGGSPYAICDVHMTEKEAREKAKICEQAGGKKHRLVVVRWLK